ncbi:MAG: hypothetical protein ACRC0L_08835 [Angustibacter sp.]
MQENPNTLRQVIYFIHATVMLVIIIILAAIIVPKMNIPEPDHFLDGYQKISPSSRDVCGGILDAEEVLTQYPTREPTHYVPQQNMSLLSSGCELRSPEATVLTVEVIEPRDRDEIRRLIAPAPYQTLVIDGEDLRALALNGGNLRRNKVSVALRVDDEHFMTVTSTVPEVSQARVDSMLQWALAMRDRLRSQFRPPAPTKKLDLSPRYPEF